MKKGWTETMKEYRIETVTGVFTAWAKDYAALLEARPEYGHRGYTVYERVKHTNWYDDVSSASSTALAPDDATIEEGTPHAWWVDVHFFNNTGKYYTYWTDHRPDGPIPLYAVVESPYSGKTLVSVRGIRPMQDLPSALAGNWKRIIGFVDTTGYDRYIADTKRRKIERDVVEAERTLRKLRSQLDKFNQMC